MSGGHYDKDLNSFIAQDVLILLTMTNIPVSCIDDLAGKNHGNSPRLNCMSNKRRYAHRNCFTGRLNEVSMYFCLISIQLFLNFPL